MPPSNDGGRRPPPAPCFAARGATRPVGVAWCGPDIRWEPGDDGRGGEPGTKVFSALRFDHPALADMSWPCISIRGGQDGPTVCVTAGMHGSEYAGIAPVRAGQVVGRLRDLWGRHLEDVAAPRDGEVLFFSTSMAAKRGQLLFGLGAPVPEL